MTVSELQVVRVRTLLELVVFLCGQVFEISLLRRATDPLEPFFEEIISVLERKASDIVGDQIYFDVHGTVIKTRETIRKIIKDLVIIPWEGDEDYRPGAIGTRGELRLSVPNVTVVKGPGCAKSGSTVNQSETKTEKNELDEVRHASSQPSN